MKHTTAAFLFSLAVTTLLAAQGANQPPGCQPAGGLSFVCGITNAEDLVRVPDTAWLLASGMAPGSGLHAVDTKAKAVRVLYGGAAAPARGDKTRFANCPGPLDPKQAVLHGLSLRPAGASNAGSSRVSSSGHYMLYATNHGGRESVEVFDIALSGGTPAATWIGCVVLPAGLAANSVAAFTDGSLLATVLIMPGKTFEDAFAQRPTGIVLAWKPGEKTFRQLPGTELPANNGIETSPDDREFYVASTTTKRIIAYARDKPGVPLRTAQLKEIGPDNVRWMPDGTLITAGVIDNEPSCGGPPKTEEGIRCPRGFVALSINPTTMAITEIARGPATPAFTGTAIAMRVGNELWLGSFFADRLAYRVLAR
jgi:hypothetical protein